MRSEFKLLQHNDPQFGEARQFLVIGQERLTARMQRCRNLQRIWCAQMVPSAKLGCNFSDFYFQLDYTQNPAAGHRPLRDGTFGMNPSLLQETRSSG